MSAALDRLIYGRLSHHLAFLSGIAPRAMVYGAWAGLAAVIAWLWLWPWPWLAGIVIGWGLLMLALVAFQGRLSVIPLPFPPAPDPFWTDVTTTTADGLTLRHWFRPGDADKPLILLLHGNAGHRRSVEPAGRLFAGLGFPVFLAEYRGFAGNSGAPSEAGFAKDVDSIMTYLASHGRPASQIVAVGLSLGAGIAATAAARHDLAGVVTVAGFARMRDMAKRELPGLPVHRFLTETYDAASALAASPIPKLIIHGDADWRTPARFSNDLFAAAAEPKQLILMPGYGHWQVLDASVPQIAAFSADVFAKNG